ncbi:MAG: Ubiquitin fusion degradation protein 4 [Cirrosporium novae-zelandiae]|nr:MAG: Ubiquitin fusion degradation protein 4 [Cirrosporium novae-zelandiae]
MPSRVTRSAARLAAESAANQAPSNPPPPPQAPQTRKRKAAARRDQSPDETFGPAEPTSSTKRSKRQKTTTQEPNPPPTTGSRRRRAAASTVMSSSAQSPDQVAEPTNPAPTPSSSSKRKSSRNKKTQGIPSPKKIRVTTLSSQYIDTSPSAPTSSKRYAKRSSKRDKDVAMKDADEKQEEPTDNGRNDIPGGEPSESNDGDSPRDYDDDLRDDPFGRSLLGGPGRHASGLSSTLRALSGMMASASSRLRDILNNLRQKEDPSVQLIALTDLSELLLISSEDNLSGQFPTDQFIKELVPLMQPNDFGEENPEMMLLACRCIANLMEALPSSTTNVVYGGAVPILCQKLLEIHYIDLAEQALITLEKISVEFPASIVREGGLTACLTYLDFFATATQRTAVTTAANCCRNIPEDSFPVIRDVMPILLNVLGSSDQKVVEKGCLCVSGIVDSFKYHPDKLEELVSAELLQAILRLLLPGTTNLIGPNIHTQFLKVLAIIARESPRLSVELLKMHVVDTLYQILTGVSPPAIADDTAAQTDSMVVMQALIHRPREHVFETLKVVCELLPMPKTGTAGATGEFFDAIYHGDISTYITGGKSGKSPTEKRLELLKGCKQELKRFALILLPTLTDAFSSTVNLEVRQKVLTAQLKMISNLDTAILEDALRSVPYASFLASILSQQDHPTLVISALQIAELLLNRLGEIYRYQFYREGVIAEISKLAALPSKKAEEKAKVSKGTNGFDNLASDPSTMADDHSMENQDGEDDENEDTKHDEDSSDEEDRDEDHDDEPDDDQDDMAEDISGASSESDGHYDLDMDLVGSGIQDIIISRAKRFLETHEDSKSQQLREKADKILAELREVAKDIEACYFHGGNGDGDHLFHRLASYFDGDALDSITSFELLNSEIIRLLVNVFTNSDDYRGNEARTTFLEVFMGTTVSGKPTGILGKPQPTPFSCLVHKLQDLLSRAEHFEVVTVHHNSYESNRSSAASMLAKQLRLKLVADEDSDIPRPYRNIMVSIHAIATFKALDDYLRPRISLSERPRAQRHRDGASSAALAAYAAAVGLPDPRRFAERGFLGSEDTTLRTPSGNPSTGRDSRNAARTRNAASEPSTRPSSENKKEKPATRRSTRRHMAQTEAVPAAAPARPGNETPAPQLECADERQLTDEDNMDDDEHMDAIVDDLEDDLDDEDMEDPSAVNVEVASTGKITARKEDGTRVATPQSTTPLSRPPPVAASSTPPVPAGLSHRHLSYAAAAMQAIPQDWHIEFSIDDKPIPNSTTIYRSVHHNRSIPEDGSNRTLWSAIHSIKFRRVPGPPPPEPSAVSKAPGITAENTASGMPLSLDRNPMTSAILRLLSILHELNANIEDVLAENRGAVQLTPEPVAQFVNTKLTAKLNRQLEEPLIVASACLPTWSEDLARLFPFLFPFETRHLFLQSTSFGYSRSMMRWQGAQQDAARDRHRDERPFLGRLQRQKVRISRTRILESAIKVMELYGASPSVLEVEYFEEVGTGLGPTLEFYSTISKEFSKKKLKMWRENDSQDQDEYAFGKLGLFPAPMSEDQATHENGKKILHLFKMLGKFVARSMLDSRIIDVSFNPTFFRIGDGTSAVKPSMGAVKTVDGSLARSLKIIKQYSISKKKIEEDPSLTPAEKVKVCHNIQVNGAHVEDMGLDFTLPGYPSIELIVNGSNISVTIDNVDLYVEKVIDYTLGSGVRRQIDAFREGFSQVFPYSALRAFTPHELVMLFGRIEEDWTIETLTDSIKADHGFNMDSKSVRNLLQTMSELSVPERRDFLQFITGSPKLPIGGFKSLTPMFTVVCKPSEPPYTSDDYLPSVMTCVNYLKLPDYSNLNVLRQKLTVAIHEGQGAFHLS